MRVATTLATLTSVASGLLSSRQASNNASTTPNVVASQYDGSCFYPVPDAQFDLESYLGTWYQVAGTPFGPTRGARCISAKYSLNDNGTVQVVNMAVRGNISSQITGTATPVNTAYGAGGAFVVSFPGQPAPRCSGPNYIVQDYAVDWAIVQTQNWSTSYILSRERQPAPATIDGWISRAVAFGSDASSIMKFNQTGCGSS